MPVREIRRESFTHQGRAYALVVIDDGKRLTTFAERDGKMIRASRSTSAPSRRNTAEQVDDMIDAVKRWLVDHARGKGGGPFF